MSISKFATGFIYAVCIFAAGWFSSVFVLEVNQTFGSQEPYDIVKATEQQRFVREANESHKSRQQSNQIPSPPVIDGYFTIEETGELAFVKDPVEKSWAKHPGQISSDAIGDIPSDWSQVNLTFKLPAKSSSEIAYEFNKIEGAINAAAAAIDLQDIELKTIERAIIPVDDSGAPENFKGALIVAIIYPGSTSFSDLLTQTEMPPNFAASTPIHWFEDKEESIQPLKNRALSKIYKRARDIYGPAIIRLDHVRYATSLDTIQSYKYKTTPVRVRVSADASISLHNPNP
ncbi:MAG: hypothetical protein AAGH74_14905 [Pseudomonadota bacterium]